MADEQVRIDLVANDQASKKIDAVADDVADLEKLSPEIEITADDKATADLKDITADAKALDKLEPEITVGIDDNATSDLKDIAGDAKALTRADHELILKAKIDQAKGELRELRSDLEQTGDKADDTRRQMDRIGGTNGPGLAGNAVADLTGPLGEASGAASDIAGVFEGLGDITGAAAQRVGLDAEKMAGAITGIGFAVTAAAALWTYFHTQQQKAREKQRELVEGQRELTDAIRDGDSGADAAKFDEMYGDAITDAERFGISVSDATKFITGQTDELPELEDALSRVNDMLGDHQHNTIEVNNELQTAKTRLQDAKSAIDNARESYRNANGTLQTQDDRLKAVAGALDVATESTDGLTTAQREAKRQTDKLTGALEDMRGELDVEDLMLNFQRDMIAAVDATGQSFLDQREDVLALKQTVVDVGEEFKINPLEIRTVLQQIEDGDLTAARLTVEQWYEDHPVQMAMVPNLKGTTGQGFTPGYPGPQMVGPEIGTLNMTLPAGWRGDPIRLAHAQRRRTGRYFARTS